MARNAMILTAATAVHAEYSLVGHGWCLNDKAVRVSDQIMDFHGGAGVRPDGGSAVCEEICSASNNCIGYLTEDDTDLCATIPKGQILQSTDTEHRNYCWKKGSALASSSNFDDFKARYGKVYNGDDESAFRATYEDNMRWAAENSAPDLTFGENQFSDLNQEQYRVAAGLGFKASEEKYGSMPHLGVHTHNGEKLADSVDWTTQGAVTPVKDQGQCGSCWAFSTTGGLEGAWQVGTGQLTSMSEQFLVDCSLSAGEGGCQGGSMENGFVFVHNNGIATESSYPYMATDGSCQSGFSFAIPAGGVAGYMSVDQSTQGLQSALQNGPVSVAIQADQRAFQAYSGGVLVSKFLAGCGTQLDHGVLAVGYDSESFKVKNSWGANWGVDGYIKISNTDNTCGIHSDASYPVVSGSVAV